MGQQVMDFPPMRNDSNNLPLPWGWGCTALLGAVGGYRGLGSFPTLQSAEKDLKEQILGRMAWFQL